MNANTFLTASQRKELEAKIQEVETRTSAEIVCAVATESGRYDRAESLVGLLAALLALCLTHAARGGWLESPGAWSASGGPALGWQAFWVVAGFVAGSVLASYWAPLRRLFVSSREMQEEVARAASHVFALGRLAATRERTGLLIYVSLFERHVVILADTRAAEALGEDGLGVLRDIAAGRLREGKTIETFLETLQVAAERLAAALPPGAENPEEISGQVLLFHPRP